MNKLIYSTHYIISIFFIFIIASLSTIVYKLEEGANVGFTKLRISPKMWDANKVW